MPTKQYYKASKTVLTYGYLFNNSVNALERGKNAEHWSIFDGMSTLVFAAFALEAYFNHLGEGPIDLWSAKDSIAVMAKLRLLYKFLGLEFDISRKPLQMTTELFRFRNVMAHGSTDVLEDSGEWSDQAVSPVDLLEPWWQKKCADQQWCERVQRDTKEIMVTLHTAAELGNDPFQSIETGSSERGPVLED